MQHQGGEDYAGDRVLCKGLYDKLWQVFDRRISIANEGEPFRSTVTRSMTGRTRMDVSESGEYYCVACPFCNDTRKRLWINHMFGQLDHDGWPMKFLAICYNEHCMDKADNRARLYDIIYGFRNANQRNSGPVFGVREVEFDDNQAPQVATPPGLVLPLTDLYQSNPNHPALLYMLYIRQYSLEKLARWGVGYCSSAVPRFIAATNRIIFPIIFNGQYVGWQGRYIGDLPDWSGVPKYYTMPGLKKQRMFYNFDSAVTQSCAVLVEGVTDTHNVGLAGMATLGSSVSVMQAQLLALHFTGKPIIMLYDPEAVDETQAAVLRLMQYCTQSPVIDVKLPDGTDPGSLAHEVIWSHIISQAAARGVRVSKCAQF